MQTRLAECLEMERGTSKEVTSKEHLERTNFIIARQEQEAEQSRAEKDAAAAGRDAVIQEMDKAKSKQDKNRKRQTQKVATPFYLGLPTLQDVANMRK